MRKIVGLIAVVIIISVLSGCGLGEEILKLYHEPQLLDGYIDKEEHFEKDGFQDFTNYCKYIYDDKGIERFSGSELYHKVKKKDIEKLKYYVNDFKQCMKCSDRLGEYDFDASQITEGDYYNLLDKQPKIESYTLYLFDSESGILYYFQSKW